MRIYLKITRLAPACFLFVATLLAQSGWDAHLAKLNAAVKCRAAMYGHDGIQWAGQSQLKLPADEIKYILQGFTNPNSLFQKGPTIEGLKYMTTRADSTLIMLKHGPQGAVFAKTPKTVVACRFDESATTPANANIAVGKFVDYLATIGY